MHLISAMLTELKKYSDGETHEYMLIYNQGLGKRILACQKADIPLRIQV